MTCDDIVLNVYAPTEHKEELERVLDEFPKYYTKILLGYSNANIRRKYIFKATIWNESLHEINNDSGVRVVNFGTLQNLIVEYVTTSQHS
jgi:hypothetical protein